MNRLADKHTPRSERKPMPIVAGGTFSFTNYSNPMIYVQSQNPFRLATRAAAGTEHTLSVRTGAAISPPVYDRQLVCIGIDTIM
jgi:hypothetical protein